MKLTDCDVIDSSGYCDSFYEGGKKKRKPECLQTAHSIS